MIIKIKWNARRFNSSTKEVYLQTRDSMSFQTFRVTKTIDCRMDLKFRCKAVQLKKISLKLTAIPEN